MNYLNRYFIALILSFSLVGMLFAPPPSNYKELIEQGKRFFETPSEELNPRDFDDFLSIPVLQVPKLKFECEAFQLSTTIKSNLDLLRDFLSRNKKFEKLSDVNFSIEADIGGESKTLLISKTVLASEEFKAYCRAIGYFVDDKACLIIKTAAVDYKPLLTLLNRHFSIGKADYLTEQRLKALDSRLVVSVAPGVVAVPRADDPVIVSPPSEDEKRKAAIEARLKKFNNHNDKIMEPMVSLTGNPIAVDLAASREFISDEKLEKHEKFVDRFAELFDQKSSSTEIVLMPKPDSQVAIFDFLNTPISSHSELKIDDPFFNEDTISGLLNKLRIFCKKNGRWIKVPDSTSGDFRFPMPDEAISAQSLVIVPTLTLESRALKAYLNAVGYRVDSQTGEITKCQENYALLRMFLCDTLFCLNDEEQLVFRRKKALERFNPRSTAVVVPPVVVSKPPEADPVADSPIPSESVIDSPSEVVNPPASTENLTKPKGPNPLKTDLIKSKSSNLIFKIGLPIGATVFLLIGFSDKIKEYFSKKSLTKSKKLKQKIESERVRVLCSLAALACVGGAIFVFTR